MPQPVAQLEEPLAVVGRDDLAVPVEVGEIAHARAQPALRRLADGARPHLLLERPECAAEGELLLVGDVLVVEHQHGVAVHAGVDRRGVRGAERLAEIEARDLAADDRVKRPDFEGHRDTPLQSGIHSMGFLCRGRVSP